MSDIEFIDGLNAKAPNDNAPEYVKGKLSIKREALIAFLQKRNDDWINADIKVAKSGKWYVAIDSWKPDSQRSQGQERQQSRQEPARHADASNGFVDDSEIPFAPIPLRRHW